MRLTLVNGSPRGAAGNTARVLEAFVEGLREGGVQDLAVRLVRDLDEPQAVRAAWQDSEALLLAFPLYVYSLPAPALRFVSRLASLAGTGTVKSMAFLCQYGFREACHARPCERQLRRAAESLGVRYGGTLIRGGCEGLREFPRPLARRILDGFRQMGLHYARNGLAFDPERLREFAGPEHARDGLLTWLGNRAFAGVANRVFWRPQLVRNEALEREDAQPLLQVGE